MEKHVICYSGGHSSALCAIEATRKYGPERVILLNHDICQRVEHQDIKRFKEEVAAHTGTEIIHADMPGCKEMDQFDVCIKVKAFKVGHQSDALCTNRLKTQPFARWLKGRKGIASIIYGFDPREVNRMERRRTVLSGYNLQYPLAEWERTIAQTEDVGIDRPETYGIWRHANCIGCLKGGKQHWYCVYVHRPDIYEKAIYAERVIGHSILRDATLLELAPQFEGMQAAGIEATEQVIPQRFWADVRRAGVLPGG